MLWNSQQIREFKKLSKFTIEMRIWILSTDWKKIKQINEIKSIWKFSNEISGFEMYLNQHLEEAIAKKVALKLKLVKLKLQSFPQVSEKFICKTRLAKHCYLASQNHS